MTAATIPSKGPVTRSLTSLKGIVKKPGSTVSIEDMKQAIAERGASAR